MPPAQPAHTSARARAPLAALPGGLLSTGEYWDEHRYLGEVVLDAESRLLVSLACRAGGWFVRLRTYRLGERGGKPQWLPTNQLLLLPFDTVPALTALLHRATTLPSAPWERLSAAESPHR